MRAYKKKSVVTSSLCLPNKHATDWTTDAPTDGCKEIINIILYLWKADSCSGRLLFNRFFSSPTGELNCNHCTIKTKDNHSLTYGCERFDNLTQLSNFLSLLNTHSEKKKNLSKSYNYLKIDFYMHFNDHICSTERKC